ncbi:MAG: hypothetical protein IPF57_11435 [Gammaproteobacteria bacterium]|jgi:hypothetical protein|nr:hypothetical protein [Gammaproteobacteria bacterium]MBK9467935.1 hypothetical protein [Gammaproteobacteria bacterium]MBP6480428.1 hypothetical protein [Pseudomonadales bacterium]MBP7910178.1 hypothetical protein [Pseudomonadales bacterium]
MANYFTLVINGMIKALFILHININKLRSVVVVIEPLKIAQSGCATMRASSTGGDNRRGLPERRITKSED